MIPGGMQTERDELLQREAATADQFWVSNSSPATSHAIRLCDAAFGVLDDQAFYRLATRGVAPFAYDAWRRAVLPSGN
jgi:hypothetical protein